MRNFYRNIGIATLFIHILLATFATATTNIDTSFGEDGYTLQDFGIGDDEAYAIAVQEDGKIVVTGYKNNGSVKNLIVSRFTEDGTLDSDFNSGGVYSVSLGSGDTIGRSLVIQEDGDIIVGGSSYDEEGIRVVVLRLTSEGYLDSSFSDDGYILFSEGDGDISSTTVLLTDEEKLVVAATIAPEDSESYAFFARLDTEGALDTSSFGDSDPDTDEYTGYTTYTDDSNDVQINSLLILSSGKILGGGSFDESDNHQAGLLQLTDGGVLDTSYDSDGTITLDLGGTSSVINAMVEGSDGNIIIAGAINNGEYDEAFVGELEDDGTTLSDFGTSGTYTTTYSLDNAINDISLTDDGVILAVGFMTSSSSKDIFVLSLEEDTESQLTAVTFVTTDIAENDDVAYAAIALDDDTLLATGSASNGADLDVALLRFADSDSLSSSEAVGSTDGVVTSGFRLTTKSVNSITRVSAVSGGSIKQLSSDDTDELTITQKGVVYGTTTDPEYDDDDDSDDSDDSDDDDGSTGGIFPDDSDSYIVRLGYTSDGDDTDSYTSNVEDITPGTTYYLRAYAILSDDTIIYGNEYRFTTDDACFIATAAYGSILEKHVVLLRQFRDSYLLTNNIGQRFVALYYHLSPPIADTIRDNTTLQTMVRIALFPAILLALFFVKTTLITKIICLAIGLPGILLLSFKYFTTHQVTTT